MLSTGDTKFHEGRHHSKIVTYISARVGGLELPILVDTGAGRSVISSEMVRELGTFKIRQIHPETKMFSASGDRLKVIGIVTIPCLVENIEFPVDFTVIENLKLRAILGMNTLRCISAVIDIGKGTCKLRFNNQNTVTKLLLSPEKQNIVYLAGTYELDPTASPFECKIVNKNNKVPKKVKFSRNNDVKYFQIGDPVHNPTKKTSVYNPALWQQYLDSIGLRDPPPRNIRADSSVTTVKSILKSAGVERLLNRETEIREQSGRECNYFSESGPEPEVSNEPNNVNINNQFGINNIISANANFSSQSDNENVLKSRVPISSVPVEKSESHGSSLGASSNEDTLEKLKVNIVNEVSVKTKIENTCEINTDLDKEVRNRLLDILYENRETFDVFYGKKIAGNAKFPPIKLELKDDKPVACKTYRTSLREAELYKEVMDEYIEDGIAIKHASAYSSPSMLIRRNTKAKSKRKDELTKDDMRLVVNYKKLNEKLISVSHPILRIEDLLTQLRKSRYFITLDLSRGYHQLKLDEKSRDFLTFSSPECSYTFLVLPFGLASSPAIFMRAMKQVFYDFPSDILCLYLDDLTIHSDTQNNLFNLVCIVNIA